MKILVLTNLYPPDVIGGYELGCKQAVDALLGRGHDARVMTIAPRMPMPPEPHVHRVFKVSEVWHSNRYVLEKSHDVTNRLLEAESTGVNAYNVHMLTKMVEKFQPDVVYVWMIVGIGGLGLMAAVQHLKLPWVWHLMDNVPIQLCRSRGKTVEPLLNEVSRQLDGKFLSCSRQLVDEIEGQGMPLGRDVEVITNWVVGDPPSPRTRFYRPGQTLRILNAGQVAEHKGVGILIDAVAEARRRGFEDFEVDIYGNVEDHQYPTKVRQLGLGKVVRFPGSRSQAELDELYAEYDLFAFPTWAREPFGFAPLEAARRGCVPVVSQRNGYAEWMVSGVHTLKAERTPEAFADAFINVYQGTTPIEPMARRIAGVINRDFHIDAQVPKIERALGEASRRSRQGGGTTAEAYRLALLAEKLTKVMVQEAAACA